MTPVATHTPCAKFGAGLPTPPRPDRRSPGSGDLRSAVWLGRRPATTWFPLQRTAHGVWRATLTRGSERLRHAPFIPYDPHNRHDRYSLPRRRSPISPDRGDFDAVVTPVCSLQSD
jgi:hypothetical protein